MSKEQIFNTISKYALAWDKRPDQDRLKVYTEAISQSGYTASEVKQVMAKLVRTLKFFPSLAEIFEGLNPAPSQEDATLLANDILKIAFSYSQYDKQKMRDEIGEFKFSIIERMGGIATLANLTYDELPATRAQLERLCKAVAKNRHQIQSDFISQENMRKIETGGHK